MARSVADLAPLLAVLAGFDPEDSSSVRRAPDNYLAGLELDLEGMRLGLAGGFYAEEVDEENLAAIRAAAEVFERLGAVVEEVDLPGAAEAYEAANQLVRAEAFAIHRERLATQPDLFGEDVRRRLLLGEQVSGSDYAAHRQTGRQWRRTMQGVLDRVNAVLTPATGTVAPLAETAETIETTRRLARLTYGWSLAGLPVLAMPCGLSADGLPIGLQLAAAPWREAELLRLGSAYQRETRWHLLEPQLEAVAVSAG
jgi:aspartyl-tRNA(Asn)/glutamyl-tRNA(Gln) amidotransferase subunit A